MFTRKSGEQVLVKAKVSDVVVDQIASQMVYQHSSHAAYGYGCTDCDAYPVREENGQRWPLKSGNLRHEDNNQIGLAVVPTAFAEIAPPSLMRLDGLHILDEGLVKSLLFLLFKEYKILENIMVEINRSMLKLGSSSLNLKTNAHETRRLFAICIPIIFVNEKHNVRVQIACLFWLLCRLLYSKYLNTTMIDDISPLFEEIGALMGEILGNSFRTIKGHKFFGHGGAELKKHGTPADYSAAVYECANRLLKLLIDPYNTRGFDRQLLRK
uniref:Abortive infection protein-like C-terminal domain-containing protein n=1 Tax=Panagrolaimus davidi TaxID=227884 RepID=A0A914Q759_9BILA